MKLVIVESPTKTKSLSKYLGKDYEIMASMGHIRDLPESKFGLEIKEKGKGFEFVPEYKIMEGKEPQVKKLVAAAKKADEVILASDPDREGEAISYHVSYLLKDALKKKKVPFKRIAFHSITKEAILDALEHPREVDMNLVDAQQGRRFLDRLVGFKLSPILWKKVRRGLSAGRVQSVALRLVVDKEREIEAFKPVEYWQIKVEVQTDKGEVIVAELVKQNGKKFEVGDGVTAKKVVEDLENGKYLIADIVKKERKASPHPPFKTSTMQQASANVLGWSAKRTMSVAQKLYELGNITYHRTDSLNLAPVALEAIRGFVGNTMGKNYLSDTARVFKTGGKVVAQEAHEAIRPTHMEISPEKFSPEDPKMAADLQKLYGLIWRRTIACQMSDAIFDDTKLVIETGNYGLQANGEIIKFDGWKKLYEKEKKEAIVLPSVSKGEELKKKKVIADQKFTQPPARYNDAGLIKELEKRGIGRPSTYAAIISTIVDRNYVEQKDRRFVPTNIGLAVVDFLKENFPKEIDYEFTATMESSLDEIAEGKLKYDTMLSNFWGEFKDKLLKVDKDAARVTVPVEKTGEKCPECKEGDIVVRSGRFGKFLSCSRYPECKYKAKYIRYFEGAKCEKCGKRVVINRTKTGRDFYGCEDYPKCDWASWNKPKVEGQEEQPVEAQETAE